MRGGLASVKTDTAQERPIIFFDGVCGMCNTMVDFLVRVDRKGVFLFAPIQGETARRLLPPLPEDPQDWSLLYRDEQGLHDESDAVLLVCGRLGGPWWCLSLLRVTPRFIRNPIYRVIARRRYRLFGKREACRVPTPEERARFLP